MLNFLVLCVIEMLIQTEFTVQIVFSGYTVNVMALPNRNIKYFLKNQMITCIMCTIERNAQIFPLTFLDEIELNELNGIDLPSQLSSLPPYIVCSN